MAGRNKAKYTYFKGKGGLWYFRLIAANGKQVCASEGYVYRYDAVKATMRLDEIATEAFLNTPELAKL